MKLPLLFVLAAALCCTAAAPRDSSHATTAPRPVPACKAGERQSPACLANCEKTYEAASAVAKCKAACPCVANTG